jgi:anti-sigma factor RsiW
LGFFIGQTFYRNSARQTLLAQLTDSHIRSLMGTHLTDVISSDQHTVRPWFEGKLDFAPPVPDLSAQGFPLVGGRVEYIGGRAVAALVYERRKHFINLFIWPEAGAEALRAEPAQRGYNVMHWRRNGMNYFAVSEVSPEDIRKLGDDFAAAISPGP